MAIQRVKRKTNFTIMSNYGLKDKRMTAKAKGVLAYMLTLPDDWIFYESEIVKNMKDGRDSIRSAMRELESFGYLVRQQERNGGKFDKVDWLVSDEPLDTTAFSPWTGNPSTEKPATGKPSTENPPLLSTNITKDLNNKISVYEDVIQHLNKKADKSFKNTKSNNKHISARLNEGFTVEDMKLVIDYTVSEWKGKVFNNGKNGSDYLRPSTLFNGKFDERLQLAKEKSSKKQVREEPKEEQDSVLGGLF